MQEGTRIASDHGGRQIGVFRIRTRKIDQRRKDLGLADLLLQLNDLRLQFSHFAFEFCIALAQGSDIARRGEHILHGYEARGEPRLQVDERPCEHAGRRTKVAAQGER